MVRIVLLLGVLLAAGVVTGGDAFASETAAWSDASHQQGLDGGDPPGSDGLDAALIPTPETPIVPAAPAYGQVCIAALASLSTRDHRIRAPPPSVHSH